MADFETLLYEVDDTVAIITLNRPEKRNAVNDAMFTELGDAAERASADPEVRAVLIRGKGPSFCAGIDLSALGGLAGLTGPQFRTFVRGAQRGFRALALMEKPTVAAVQGYALGAGFQLALACDLRVGAPDVRFGMLEGRYGIIPDLGGIHHLVRLAGPSRAKDLVWTTRIIDAEEAQAFGLLDRLVPVGELHERATELLRELLAFSPVSRSYAKSLIDRAEETPLEVELEREGQFQSACLASADHREAVAAFFEKRPPKFTGK
jgi:enoyl-CoA hydratase/carnithine racemase